MYFFPYIKKRVDNVENVEIILNNIAKRVEIVEQLGITKRKGLTRSYQGKVFNDGFMLRRIPDFGYTAFSPIINGNFKKYRDNKLTLHVTIYFHNGINILIIIYYTFSFLLLLSKDIIINDFFSLLIPYAIIIGIFNIELRHFKKEAKDIICYSPTDLGL